MTRIIQYSHIKEHLEEIVQVFRDGGVVLYPTDTQYGLGVMARNRSAVEKVHAVKKEDVTKPLSIIVPSVDVIGTYVHVCSGAQKLIDAHLPGALTLVLPAKDKELARSRGDETEMGVRVPDTPHILRMVTQLGDPITTTSANIHGTAPKKNCKEILSELEGIDLAIDAGTLQDVPSTIVRFEDGATDTFTVLRAGAVSL
jgi:L-threonylcarbamoyladenylate synthase